MQARAYSRYEAVEDEEEEEEEPVSHTQEGKHDQGVLPLVTQPPKATAKTYTGHYDLAGSEEEEEEEEEVQHCSGMELTVHWSCCSRCRSKPG